MVATLKSQPATSVTRMLGWTLGAAAVATAIAVALLAALTEGQARSALLGGGIGLVANGYSAWRVFAGPIKTSAEATLANLYRAEFGKLVITGALCALAFALIEELTAAGFLAGLVSALLASTLGAIIAQGGETDETPVH